MSEFEQYVRTLIEDYEAQGNDVWNTYDLDAVQARIGKEALEMLLNYDLSNTPDGGEPVEQIVQAALRAQAPLGESARQLVELAVPGGQSIASRPPAPPVNHQRGGNGDDLEAWKRLVFSFWPEAQFAEGEHGLTAYADRIVDGNEVGNFESQSVVDEDGELHSL